MTRETAGGVGLGVAGLLVVAFVVLKLSGVIDWSWWIPLWVSLTVTGLVLLGIGLAGLRRTAGERGSLDAPGHAPRHSSRGDYPADR